MADDDIVKLIMREIQDLDFNPPKAFEGILKSWGEQKQKLFQIIVHLEETTGTNISEDDILDKAKEEEIDNETAQGIIDQLVYDGLLYRPAHMERMVRFHSRQDYSPWSEDFPS